MKKLLLSIGLLASTGLMAQNYFSEDFESGLNAWNLVDADGDNYDWTTNDYGDGQGEVATSASWDSNDGALTPDNWMISGAIDLSGATGTVYLSWLAFAQDQSWADEEYSVYVSTNNDVATMTSEGADFNEVVGTSSGYVGRSVDVSSFTGSTIYVAFRHHNVTDMYRLNIDDVSIDQVPNDDIELSAISVDSGLEGDRTFDVQVTNQGLNAVTAFDLDWSWDGGSVTTENVTGINLSYGQSHTVSVTVNGVPSGTGDFDAEVTNPDDNVSNNTLSESFSFYPPVPQYVADDSHGNQFDLHAALSSGQAIVLDFMASWCGPCESSTPEISEFVENNGSGQGNVEALAISVESTDDAATLNGLNWNGGFYEYPKFPYVADNNFQYFHYGVNHGFNTGGSIPFFVMICPNTADPENSTIVKQDVGYGQGMFGAYQTALDNCPSATAKVIEDNFDLSMNVYPNPASTNLTVNFTLTNQSSANITLVNSVGQVVKTAELGKLVGEQSKTLDVSGLESGMYIVKVKTNNGETTRRVSIVK